jgi:predicted nucleic acid-binding protein
MVNNSVAAQTWLKQCEANGDQFYGSRMLELEVRRVAQNAGRPQGDAEADLRPFHIVSITDDLIDDAIAIPYPLGGADSLHVATAKRIRNLPGFALATHDGQMASAATALNLFPVFDPVTDDPLRPPVA